MSKKIDMTGWYMPDHGVPDSIITVIEEDKEYHKLHHLSPKNTMTYWKYRCACGTIKTALGLDIRRGKVLSCGCLQRKNCRKALMKDITNQRFNHLLALYPDPNKDSGKGVFWICQCDCGNIVSVRCADLINGHTTSCGCIKSKGQEKIIKILSDNNILFTIEKTYEDLKSPLGHLLKYDFFINNTFLLEYDGEHHYKEWRVGHGMSLKTRQEYDTIKNEYAKSHNIPLKRIPYWDLDKITLENIMNDTYLINKE